MNHAQQRKDIGYLLNRKFGQLTVIGESPTRPRKGLWVTVRCDCGVERIARARSLEHGKQKTCGTLAHRNGERLAKGADLVGLRFGSLVVLRASPAPDDQKRTVVWAQCDCGPAELMVRVSDLHRGAVSSCKGPLHRELEPTRITRLDRRGRYSTYAVEGVGTGMMKIGRSFDIRERLLDMQSCSPVELRVFAAHDSGHTAKNISWVSANGNRIQGSLSLDETRAMIKQIAANYTRFKV